MTSELKRKIDFFISGFLIITFIILIGFLIAAGKGESDIGDGILMNFVADNFVYFIPSLVLWDKLNINNGYILIFMLSINITLYALIIVWISNKFATKMKRYKPFNGIYYSIVTILITLITYLIGGILNN